MRSRSLAAALLLLGPALALAGERTLILKSFEDERFPANLQVCANVGFPTNVFLGASLWSLQTNAARGAVMNETIKFLGTATGCGLMTTGVPFQAGQQFALQFDLDDGSYLAKGTCDIVSNNVPKPGLMLAGCALRIVSAPAGVLGGIASSMSIFNPYSLPGFGTGSVWTVHLYTQD